MEVKLASCGNPDHFQDPDLPMYGCEDNHFITVNSLEEASLECRKFIKRNYLGGGNWAGGTVYENNKCIAEISYNGRVNPKQECPDENKLCEEMTIAKKELIAIGTGDVPAWLAEEGLALAILYFYDHDLDPQICFEANQSGNDITLARHWKNAENIANQVLASDSRYNNSLISLDFDVY